MIASDYHSPTSPVYLASPSPRSFGETKLKT
jgi:hypothetical protein